VTAARSVDAFDALGQTHPGVAAFLVHRYRRRREPRIGKGADRDRACTANALPLRRWQARPWQTDTRTGSARTVAVSWPQARDAWRMVMASTRRRSTGYVRTGEAPFDQPHRGGHAVLARDPFAKRARPARHRVRSGHLRDRIGEAACGETAARQRTPAHAGAPQRVRPHRLFRNV